MCNAGEINGFSITGACTSFPIRQDDEQYPYFPLGTLDGQQPEPNNDFLQVDGCLEERG
jgi:hypothetical protein